MTAAAQLIPYSTGSDDDTGTARPTRRKFYALKSEWAQAMAEETTKQLEDLKATPVDYSDWRNPRDRQKLIGRLLSEASNYRDLARRHRQKEARSQ